MIEDFPRNIESSSEEQKIDKLYEVAKRSLGAVFKDYHDSGQRVESMKQEVIRMSEHLQDSQKILAELEECGKIQDKKEFVDRTFLAMKPMIDLKIKDPSIFSIEGEKERDFIQVNEVLSYEENGDVFKVHIIPMEVHPDIFKKMTEGLEKLAQIVNQNKNVTILEGDSWIVTNHPRIVEKFGFRIDDRERGMARISREEFLKKYLKNKL